MSSACTLKLANVHLKACQRFLLLKKLTEKQFFLYILGTSYPGPIPVLFLNTVLILSSSLVASLFPNAPGQVLRSRFTPLFSLN